jgi:hypothetical protein
MAAIFKDGIEVEGNCDLASADNLFYKAGSITDAAVSASAAIGGAKTLQRFQQTENFGLDSDATPVSTTRTVFMARAAGTIDYFYASMIDTGTSASSTFDLQKNGTTVLSAVVTISNTDTDRAHEAGTISVGTVAAGDELTMDLVVSTSTGATGPIACVGITYTAQPT